MNQLINILITIGIAFGVSIAFAAIALLIQSSLIQLPADLPADIERLLPDDQEKLSKQFIIISRYVSRIYFLLLLPLAFVALHLPVPYPLGTAVAIAITGILLGIFLWL